jgi:hypothetical protein
MSFGRSLVRVGVAVVDARSVALGAAVVRGVDPCTLASANPDPAGRGEAALDGGDLCCDLLWLVG